MSIVEKPPYYSNPTGRIGLLSSMYTVPGHRRQGIAKKLLGLIVDEARESGCGTIQLTASTMGAYLYKDFGFEKGHNFFRYIFDK
jgi:GNAT superfamily N-acetyltransferase